MRAFASCRTIPGAVALCVLSLSALGLSGLSGPVWADSFAIQSRVTAVKMYPEGMAITREAPVSVPTGQHELVLRDIPAETILSETLRPELSGGRILHMRVRTLDAVSGPVRRSAEFLAARQSVHDLQSRIRAIQDQVSILRLAAEEADLQATVLVTLGQNADPAAISAGQLRDLAQTAAQELRRARQTAIENETKALQLERQLPDLQAELDSAQATLDAVPAETNEFVQLGIGIETDQPLEGSLTLRYLAGEGSWQPAHDIFLDVENQVVRFERGVLVWQATGEHWQGVDLQLSTLDPGEGVAPSDVYARTYGLADPAPKTVSGAEPMVESPVIVEESSSYGYSVQSEGLALSYSFAQPVDLYSDADMLRLQLDALEFPVQLFASVTDTWSSETGFLMARFTNSSGQEILASDQSLRYVDGALVGAREFKGLVPGDETELAFGAIDGMLVERRDLDRSEGDQGLISRSNTDREARQITVRNLTDRSWPVELRGTRPLSSHDDLIIDWTADPAPSQANVDGRRGVMRWDFDLPPGADWVLDLKTNKSWPTDKILR